MIREAELPSLGERTLNSVLNLAAREVVVRSAALLGSIVVARQLTPRQFGLFAIGFFALNLFALFAELGFGAAFIRRPGILARMELDSLFTFQLFVVTILAVGMIIAAPTIARIYHAPEMLWVMRALSLSLVLISLRTAPVVASERALNYQPVALSDALRHLSFWSVASGLALAGFGLGSLIAAVIVSSAVATLTVYFRMHWVPRLVLDWRPIRANAGFAAIYQSQSLAHFLKDTMVPSVGGLLYSSASVGYLMWAVQLAQVPLLLTQLVGRVTYPALARLQADMAAFNSMLASTLKWTCRVSFPLFATLIALSPQIIQFVYGPKWAPALGALYLLYVNMMLSVGTGVLMPALYSAGWASTGLKISVAWTAVTWVSGIGLAKIGINFEALALAYVIGTSVALTLVLARLTSIRRLATLRPVIVAGIMGLLVALATRWATRFVENWWSLALLALASVLLGLTINLWSDRTKAFTAIKNSLSRSDAPPHPSLGPAPSLAGDNY